MFFDRQDLIDALKKTIKLLENSKDSLWSSSSVAEIRAVLQTELEKIENDEGFNKLELAVLFAPTGDIQETAMTNGWHEEYVEAANVIDKFTV